jgi:hypothetical protein
MIDRQFLVREAAQRILEALFPEPMRRFVVTEAVIVAEARDEDNGVVLLTTSSTDDRPWMKRGMLRDAAEAEQPETFNPKEG